MCERGLLALSALKGSKGASGPVPEEQTPESGQNAR